MLALSIACVLAAVAWGYLVAGHSGYWRTSQRPPPVTRDPDTWPDVVAVVPARNDAEAVPAVAAARARPAADCPAVRRDDRRLRAAALHRPRRGMAGPDGPGPI